MAYPFLPGTTFVQPLPPQAVPAGRPETEYKIVKAHARSGFRVNFMTWDSIRGCYGGWFRATSQLFRTRGAAQQWIDGTSA